METQTTKPSLWAVAVTAMSVSLLTSAGMFGLLVHKPPAWLGTYFDRTQPIKESAPLAGPYPTTIPDVVSTTSPAVVSIVITADVPVIEQYYSQDPFSRFFGFSLPQQRQIGTEEREIGGGTGFFVSSDGYIVTNKHVVDQANARYSVVTTSGASYEVKVVAKDPTLDIAILKVESDTSFPYLKFGQSSSLRLGETVIAIGNALAEFPNTISVGVVSGLSRNIVAGDTFGSSERLEGVIQTDAAINRGNSGGPLLNTAGEVIGVNVAAGSGENIGFALTSDLVRSVYESVAETGTIVRPFLGIRYIEIDTELAQQNNLVVDYGVLLARGRNRTELAVIPGSPADKAGLEENDIILEFAGVKLDGTKSLSSLLREHRVGETIALKVLHDGDEQEIMVTLEQAETDS